jgi:hypothetical protein
MMSAVLPHPSLFKAGRSLFVVVMNLCAGVAHAQDPAPQAPSPLQALISQYSQAWASRDSYAAGGCICSRIAQVYTQS